jgi:hypothetical protein
MTAQRISHIPATTVLTLALASTGAAQEPATAAPNKILTSLATGKPVKLVTLDLAVPDSPAFTILGLSPETVVRPSSPRDLATTVLNGVDRRGNLQSGLAVDFAPLFLFAGKTLTYNDYKDKTGTRLLGRTQISLATAKGASDGDKSLRVAVGLRATLWDEGDPRLDETLVACLNGIRLAPPTTVLATQEAIDAWIAQATAERRPKVEACHQQFKTRRWNASSFSVGLAPSWQSPTGQSGDFQFAGAAIWGSFALALTRQEDFAAPTGNVKVERPYGQFIVQGRYRNRELVPDKDVPESFFEQDSTGVGARLLLGSADFAIVTEAELARQWSEGRDATSALKLSIGGQIKLSTDVWLSAAVGATHGGPSNEQRSAFVLSSVKWALSREPAVKF